MVDKREERLNVLTDQGKGDDERESPFWAPCWQDARTWAKGTLGGMAYAGSSALADGQSFLG